MGEQLEFIDIAVIDTEDLEIDRKVRALELDAKIEELCHQAVNVKDKLCEVLIPIYEGGYWKELGFSSWKDYLNQSVRIRIQTIWNSLKPRLDLLAYGVSSADIKGVTIESRLTKLALVARHRDGKLDPSLIDKAKNAPRLRNKENEFDVAFREECRVLNIPDPRTIKIVVPEELYDLWILGLEAFKRGWDKREMGQMPSSPEVCFIEALLTNETVTQMMEEN